jgi:hypothetical protein
LLAAATLFQLLAIYCLRTLIPPHLRFKQTRLSRNAPCTQQAMHASSTQTSDQIFDFYSATLLKVNYFKISAGTWDKALNAQLQI